MIGPISLHINIVTGLVVAAHLVSEAWAASGDVSFLTLNAGFFSPSPVMAATHDARRTALVHSITSSSVWQNTDVACIQEAQITQTDFLPIASALRLAGFIHQHSFLDYYRSSGDRAACNDAAAANAFLACSSSSRAASCRAPLVEAVVALRGACIVLLCQAEFELLTQQCAECLFDHRQPAVGNLTAAFARCSVANESTYRPTFGLILASRLPLSNLETVPFKGNRTSYRIPGYLKGDIDGVGSVYCTHQTPFMALHGFGIPAPPEGGYSDFGAANVNETHRLIAAMSRGPSVLLGDLNNGPINASVSIQSSIPQAFQVYENAGIRSATILLGRYKCTFCGRSNPLLAGPGGLGGADQMLDHIMLTSHYQNSVIEAEYVFVENITGLGFPLSDHYGVRAVINTGSEHQVQLSHWERKFAAWETAFQRWQTNQCPPGQ